MKPLLRISCSCLFCKYSASKVADISFNCLPRKCFILACFKLVGAHMRIWVWVHFPAISCDPNYGWQASFVTQRHYIEVMPELHETVWSSSLCWAGETPFPSFPETVWSCTFLQSCHQHWLWTVSLVNLSCPSLTPQDEEQLWLQLSSSRMNILVNNFCYRSWYLWE